MVWRFFLSAVALCLLPLAACQTGQARAPAASSAGPLEISAAPVALNPHNPAQARVGPLLYRGGLQLTSPDKRFGGFSGLWLSPDGRHLVAVSDRGWRMDVRVAYDAQGNLKGLAGARLGRC